MRLLNFLLTSKHPTTLSRLVKSFGFLALGFAAGLAISWFQLTSPVRFSGLTDKPVHEWLWKWALVLTAVASLLLVLSLLVEKSSVENDDERLRWFDSNAVAELNILIGWISAHFIASITSEGASLRWLPILEIPLLCIGFVVAARRGS